MIAMNLRPRSLPVLSLAFSSVLALGACGRVPGQFEILNDQVPKTAGGGCSIPTDETVYSGQGTMDLQLVQPGAQAGFFFFPLIKNNLPTSGSGPDVNEIFLSSFAIDLSVASAPPATQALFNALESGTSADRALLHFKTLWSGSVASAGKISAIVPAFPVELAQRIAGLQEISVSPSLLVNVRVRAFGSTTSQTLESDPFVYPLAVCSGCLVANVQPCPYTVTPANTGNPCNVAQDVPVDCCISGSDLVCPPVVSK
jgi:hypothetical protein